MPVTQKTIKAAFLNQKYRQGDPKQEQATSVLVKMIAKDLQPLSVVEDEGFRNFVAVLDPRYNIPGRKTLRTSLIPRLFEEVRAQVVKELSESRAVALTTDMWTSPSNMSFMAVTAHFWSYETCSLPQESLSALSLLAVTRPLPFRRRCWRW